MRRVYIFHLLKPTALCASVLIATTCLVSLRLTSNIVSANIYSLRILLASISSVLLTHTFFLLAPHKALASIKPQKSIRYHNKALESLGKACNIFSLLFLSVSILQILLLKGFPLIWLFTNSGQDYQDAGIPSLQGITYTSYFLVIAIKSLLSSQYPHFKPEERLPFNKFFCTLLFLYPLLMIARGLAIYALVAYCVPRFFRSRLNIKLSAGLILFTIFALPLFYGLVGDNRQGVFNPFSYLVPDDSLLARMPSGYTWLYVYITGPINNVLNFSSSKDVDLTFNLLAPMTNLVPGALKPLVLGELAPTPGLILDPSINVASFYGTYFPAFGIIGVMVATMALICISQFFYIRAMRDEPWMLIGYSQIVATFILIPFFDNFLTVSTILILLLCFCMNAVAKRNYLR